MAKSGNNRNNAGNRPGAPAGSGKPAPPPAKAAQQKPSAARQPAQPSGITWAAIPAKYHLLIAGGIALLVWLFYAVCLQNQFTNWDDPGYVKDNSVIKDLSPEGLKTIFTTSIMGNYHPLTILSYAIDYKAAGLDPYRYHLDSLIFHIIVTLLVYVFVNQLTRKPVAAVVGALLFGLHPMHVESVAWVAGRKDVVYGMFYMGACICWIRYIRAASGRQAVWMAATLVLFVCSLLAKPVAVVLPLTLLLISYFEGRPFGRRAFFETAGMMLISIGFGIKSVMDQHAFGSLDTLNVSFTPLERLGLGAYAFETYLWKAVMPTGLSNYYPYPDKLHGGLSWVYYLSFVGWLVVLALLTIRVGGMHKAERRGAAGVVLAAAPNVRAMVFGGLFFLVNIILLLQFIPVGGAIIADRYSYIAYLGLFFMAGWWVAAVFEPGGAPAMRAPVAGIMIACCLGLGYMTHQRSEVWYDAISLWNDEIEKEPVRAPNAYNNLGFNYFNKFNESVDPKERQRFYDSAYYLLNKAIELQPNFVNPYISLGELERTAGNFPEAKKNYYKALSLKSFDEAANAYLGLAIIYAISKNYDSSNYCFRQALKAKPYFPEAHSNYGNLLDMCNMRDSAIVQYDIAIQQNPDMYAPYLNRGRMLTRMRRCDEAMKDFEKALQISPGLGEIYYARSFCYAQRGDHARALSDIQKAMSLGFRQISKEYYLSMGGK